MSKGATKSLTSSATSSAVSTTAEEEQVDVIKREDLWKDALEIDLSAAATLQITGLTSSNHTVYARVVAFKNKDEKMKEDKVTATMKEVVDRVVTESWRNIAKEILQKHSSVTADSFPSAEKLLELGAVWLLDETRYCHGEDPHAHRIFTKNSLQVPDWNNKTLRVYLAPERYFAAYEVDWTKYCRGLLVGGAVTVNGVERPHPVPVNGLPDVKDGVLVYEDSDHHFVIINKPGNVPVHPSLSNHAEDVVSMLSHALQQRHREDHFKLHVSVPQKISASLDIGTHGLLLVATQPSFAAYHTKILEKVKRSYKCLVCLPDADGIRRLEHFQIHDTPVVHYVDPKSSNPKRFVRHKPSGNGNHKHHHHKHWEECKLRIKKVGDEKFRAACVQSKYLDSVDSSLAHRLWGPESATPAEDLGFEYVMEIEVEILNRSHRKAQIRGQLAALGCPIVGDTVYGGGKSEFFSNHHSWNRMALHCCELSFPEPAWNDENEGDNRVEDKDQKQEPQKRKQRELVPTEHRCIFRHEQAWWSEFIAQYEHFHTAADTDS